MVIVKVSHRKFVNQEDEDMKNTVEEQHLVVLEEKKKPTERRIRMDKEVDENPGLCKGKRECNK